MTQRKQNNETKIGKRKGKIEIDRYLDNERRIHGYEEGKRRRIERKSVAIKRERKSDETLTLTE